MQVRRGSALDTSCHISTTGERAVDVIVRKKTVKLFDCSLFKLPTSICGIGGRALAAGCLGEFEAGPAKRVRGCLKLPARAS